MLSMAFIDSSFRSLKRIYYFERFVWTTLFLINVFTALNGTNTFLFIILYDAKIRHLIQHHQRFLLLRFRFNFTLTVCISAFCLFFEYFTVFESTPGPVSITVFSIGLTLHPIRVGVMSVAGSRSRRGW